MSERKTKTFKALGFEGVIIRDYKGGRAEIPEDEIDAIMEDIRNLR